MNFRALFWAPVFECGAWRLQLFITRVGVIEPVDSPRGRYASVHTALRWSRWYTRQTHHAGEVRGPAEVAHV